METVFKRMNAMKQLIAIKTIAAALALFFVCPLPASAEKPVTTGTGQPSHYYDGKQQRQILMDDALVAEFGGKAAATGVSGKSAVAGAQVEKSGGGATIYRMPAISAKAAVTSTNTAFSPVYHKGGTPGGPLMALPGGVVVNFNAGWTAQQVNNWAAAKGLQVDRKLEIGANWYILKTAVGQVALDTANSIYLSGEVVEATPVWWEDVAPQ